VEPVILINAGDDEAVYTDTQGNWQANRYQTTSASTSSADTVDISGVVDPAPYVIYQRSAISYYGYGNSIAWDIPVEDGDYVVRLHFVETRSSYIGGSVFDILLQDETVEANVDIYDQAGGRYIALVKDFDVIATGGSGISLDLINRSNYSGATISAIEILRVVPEGVADATVDLDGLGGTTAKPGCHRVGPEHGPLRQRPVPLDRRA
jgi:hypothetical protein